MTLFPLTSEEKNRLQKLNSDKVTIFALKKLFLNNCTDSSPSNEAIKKITESFHDLEVIRSDKQSEKQETNLI